VVSRDAAVIDSVPEHEKLRLASSEIHQRLSPLCDTFTNSHVRIEEDGRFRFASDFPHQFRKMISVTTLHAHCRRRAAGRGKRHRRRSGAVPGLFQRLADLARLRLPKYSPEKAAEIIHGISREFDFILYEYFQTTCTPTAGPSASAGNWCPG